MRSSGRIRVSSHGMDSKIVFSAYTYYEILNPSGSGASSGKCLRFFGSSVSNSAPVGKAYDKTVKGLSPFRLT